MKLKLLPELVPESSWYSNLRSMLPTESWDRVRREVYRRASNKCEICGGVGSRHPVECHERWEYDSKNGVQKLGRLIAVCPACHEVNHIGLAEMRGRRDIAVKHMSKVNGIRIEEANRIIEGAFEEWHERGRTKWKVDVSLLKELVGSLGIDPETIKVELKKTGRKR